MNWTEQEAEAAVGRMYRGCRACVEDGCQQHCSGTIQDANNTTIGSFRLFYNNGLLADEISRVREIRIGSVGQYCGTLDEIRAYERGQNEPDDDADPDPPIIKVDMEVSRCRRIEEDKAVEVWGYVGDYQARIVLDEDDRRVRRLLNLGEPNPNLK